METAVAESSETNNPSSVLEPEMTENVKSVGEKNSSDKELSWEKIAAEIAADEEEIKPHMEGVSAEIQPRAETVEGTVINNVTEEASTETNSSEVVVDLGEENIKTNMSEEIIKEPVLCEEIVKEPVISEGICKEEVEIVKEPTIKKDKDSVLSEDVVVERVASEETMNQSLSSKEAIVPSSEDVEVTVELAVPVEEVSESSTISDTLPVDEVVEAETVEETVETPLEIVQESKEMIEMSALKSDLVPEAAETLDEIEYTVLEGEEVETNEIIEEHLAQSNKGVETVVIINPDQSQTEITIEQVEEEDRNDEVQSYTEEIYLMSKENESVDDPQEVPEVKPKKPRGRKPIADIPLHVLGRDISKPSEGVSNGGRTMPKPRLGVKVPYRNLTSQIVSKQEIEKEIMERFKLKQEQNATNSGDILFARKLTQRLAKKLIPTEKDPKEPRGEAAQEAGSSGQNDKTGSDIKNNSDLLAILEGDGDDIELTKQKKQPTEEQRKRTEKEIALEQLKELPGHPQKKIYKSRNEEEKKSPATPQKDVTGTPPPVASPLKESKANIDKKNPVDLEPRLKTGMVIKTYTRKRKSTELEPPVLPPPKKTVVAATPVKNDDGSSNNVYVTKSSRIIKRKVIWDPDEAPMKNPAKSPKLETVKSPPPKAVEKKETTNDKSPEKKAVSLEKKVLSPAKKSPIIKKPKRLTEVDRLLMDEGAVNMIYDVKNTNDDPSPKKKSNKSVISLDRAHKELMSKTNVIKNDLQQNTSKDGQKSLRKKEIVSPTAIKREVTPSAVTRKKSKDSARSSVHSPPASPPYIAAEASRIIRRHSSSSFSSNDELDDEDEDDRPLKKKNSESKKKPKKVAKETAKNNNNTVPDTKVKENHIDKTAAGPNKAFTVTKKNKLAAIKLQSAEGRSYLNEQVLKDLICCLKNFEKDDDCHVVSITSDCPESFCEGLDYRLLVIEDENARKKKANEVASLVKEFLWCLLNFPKVLVAGIQGDCVGLGVTMLPLFDMVVASDTATFSTPYASLGCVPEAGFLLTVPHLSSNGLASELLYASQIIKADDAFRRGLVSRLCWPEKYQQELKSLLSQVANQSRETLVETKQQLRHNIMQATDSSLSSVSKVLVEYWTSPECQKNFAK